MILVIGDILFDHFPNYKRLGGAAFNFAYHLVNLNLPVRFISRVGKEEDGNEILKQLRTLRFPISDIQIDDLHPTGKVLVELTDDGIPNFTILPNVAYDYITFANTISSVLDNQIELIYFGTLAQRNEQGFKTMQKILSRKNPHTKCLYDINLRLHCYNKKIIIKSLKQADVLKLNDEEFDTLKQMMGFGNNTNRFVDYLINEYSLEMISLTKGEKGSDLLLKDKRFSAKSDKINNIVDTVGAGDAYAAILAIGYQKKWAPEKILAVATEFASRICEIKGAIPSSKQLYKKYKQVVKDTNPSK
jgi:fructokinase